MAALFCFFAFFLLLAFDLLLDLAFALTLGWPSLAWVVVAALADDVTKSTGIARTAALIKVAKSFFIVRSLLLTLKKYVGLHSGRAKFLPHFGGPAARRLHGLDELPADVGLHHH